MIYAALTLATFFLAQQQQINNEQWKWAFFKILNELLQISPCEIKLMTLW